MQLSRRKLFRMADGVNLSKAGMIDYLFEYKPKYLLICEIDKYQPKTNFLNLMEIGIVTETNHRKTRTAKVNH